MAGPCLSAPCAPRLTQIEPITVIRKNKREIRVQVYHRETLKLLDEIRITYRLQKKKEMFRESISSRHAATTTENDGRIALAHSLHSHTSQARGVQIVRATSLNDAHSQWEMAPDAKTANKPGRVCGPELADKVEVSHI
jgi:hypothetical protein